MDGWKIDVVTDATNGKVFQNESFSGPEVMGEKDEQMYLGDIIPSHGAIIRMFKTERTKCCALLLTLCRFGSQCFSESIILKWPWF